MVDSLRIETTQGNINGSDWADSRGLGNDRGNIELGSQENSSSPTFSSLLEKSMNKVNQFQHEADASIKELIAGRNKNIHETMLAVERADLSLKLMVQIRNKVLDAYREIMRMQV